MSRILTCPQGHQWEFAVRADASTTDVRVCCPVCGAAVELLELVSWPGPETALLPHTPTQAANDAPPAPPPAAEPAPRPPCLPGYEILGELGRGGMGVVYKARQVKLHRLVALKMILAGSHAGPTELARFRIEAEAVARLQHPNIVQIHEVGEQEGRPFFSLEFVEGGCLSQQLNGTPRPPRPAAQLVETLARAVHAAHQCGVVHRDLKPSNVLLTADGTPKITDFGLAKRLHGAPERAAAEPQTQTGSILGTPSYMAPEQARGHHREIGPRSDVYALGAILYELLTGRPPFRAASPLDTIMLVIGVEPVPPRRLQPKLPRDLETICLKCLEKDPRKRYAGALDLAADLRRYLDGEPILARPTPAWERGLKWARRRPAVAALLAAVIGVTLLGFGLVTAEWRREVAARRDADEQRREAERLLVRLSLDRGHTLCEQGDVGRGMLWLAQTLALVPADNADLRRAVRADLAAWRRRIHPLRNLLPHPAPVRSAAFSPDGRMVLTVSEDHGARLWEAATGNRIGPPLEHPGPILAAAFSPDSRLLITGCADGQARLWDPATGQAVGKTLDHPGPVRAAAFSPDGRTVLTGSDDGAARLWEVSEARLLHGPLTHGGPVRAVAFDPAGKVLLTGNADGTVGRWWADTGKPLGPPLATRGGEVWAVGFAPDGESFFTASKDIKGSGEAAVQLWKTATGQRRATLPHRYWVRAVAFSPDGRTVLSGGEDHKAYLWDTATGKLIERTFQHQDWVEAVAFSPDGRTLLTGSQDQTARLWETATGRPLGQPLEHQGPVVAVAFSPDGKSLLTASQDHTVRVWATATGELPHLEIAHRDEVMAVAFHPNGKLLATGSGSHQARLWDALTGQPVGPALPHDDEVWTLAFHPDGKTLATGSRDKTVRQWDVASGKPVGGPLVHEHWVRSLAYSRDGRLLLTGSGDRTAGKARLWDAATGTPLGEPLEDHDVVWSVAFSPDGQTFVMGSGDHTARLWDLATRKPFGAPLQHQNRVVATAFSPDGRVVLTGSTDGTGRRWDAATGEPVGEPLRHHGAVWGVAFTPDGRAVVTGGRDQGARLWDAATGTRLGPPWAHPNVVWAVACRPDGRAILTGSADRTARLWPVVDPVAGEVDRVLLWVQVITGLELDRSGAVHWLEPSAWQERRQRLEDAGGPPLP